MNVSFATICPEIARRFLSNPSYDWLNQEAKDKAIELIGEKTLRVQDPMMYPHPQLEILNESTKAAILAVFRPERQV